MIIFSPLEQFRYPIINVFFSFVFDTNLSIYCLFLVQFSVMYLMYIYLNSVNIIPNRLAVLFNEIYKISYSFMVNFLGISIEEKNVYPAILTLFLFLLMLNLSGLIPYTTTLTTHFFVTGGLAFSFIIGMTFINFYRNGLYAFNTLSPKGIPILIKYALTPIEFILYIFRPISLSVRLFANMMAGHALLKIISGVIYYATFKTVVFFAPLKFFFFFLFIGALNFILLLEFLVCMIQAYVFTLLICLYIKDIYVNNH